MFTDFHLGATPKLNGENFRNPGPLARESDWVRLPQEGLGCSWGVRGHMEMILDSKRDGLKKLFPTLGQMSITPTPPY